VFQELRNQECHFINGTEQVRFVERKIYNRQQYVHFDSDVGVFVGDTPFGEVQARHWNSQQDVSTPFLVNRRVPPSMSISLVRWFQDGQELPEHVVATDVVPNGDWTYQVLVMLEIPPRRGVTYTCQVEHISLEHPLSRHWEMPQDTVHSKILVGVGGFVLGFVFLVVGLGFYLREKSS
ncbi:class II histocompatibility antigen, B-L beta chain-like, partial [Myiozetetes cayanensis]|uniref:class II histocompatibility antigen, B-L beta chain-like n=1 Tax=Myiozetetes cayanensis TaxID=478635 RepID=UPI00215F70EB